MGAFGIVAAVPHVSDPTVSLAGGWISFASKGESLTHEPFPQRF